MLGTSIDFHLGLAVSADQYKWCCAGIHVEQKSGVFVICSSNTALPHVPAGVCYYTWACYKFPELS